MRRPVGLILTQIALAGLAFLQLCGLLGTVAVAFGSHTYAPSPNVPNGLILGMMAVFGLIFAGLTAWSIATIVGLARLRSWARYSVLVMGGLLAVFGALFAAGSLAGRALAPRMPAQPGQTPESMAFLSYAFLAIALFYFLMAATGVFWLVFFNLRSTKVLFEPLNSAYPAPPPMPGRFDHIPTPILALAALYALSTITTAGAACLSLPAFMMGIIVTGVAMHVVYGLMAVLSGYIAYGLFRLDNRARVTALAFTAFGAVNIALSLVPAYQARMRMYTRQILLAMHMPQNGTPDFSSTYGFTLVTNGFAVVMMAVLVWVLIRYRPAFRPA